MDAFRDSITMSSIINEDLNYLAQKFMVYSRKHSSVRPQLFLSEFLQFLVNSFHNGLYKSPLFSGSPILRNFARIIWFLIYTFLYIFIPYINIFFGMAFKLCINIWTKWNHL